MTGKPFAAFDLTDKVAIVTGASRGIGAAVAETLLGVGASVVLAVRTRTEELEDTASEWEKRFSRPTSIVSADVTDEAAVAELYKSVFKESGRLDIVVNNAGIMEDAPIGMIDPVLVNRVIGTNLVGTINHCRYAARLMMRKRAGCIVNVASIVAAAGSPGQSVYAASKAGVIGLTKSLARELGPYGLRVNAVAPGFIDTELTARFQDRERQEIEAKTALGRLGTPSDVALAVAFLASDAAGFITGQTIGVDGGLVA